MNGMKTPLILLFFFPFSLLLDVMGLRIATLINARVIFMNDKRVKFVSHNSDFLPKVGPSVNLPNFHITINRSALNFLIKKLIKKKL